MKALLSILALILGATITTAATPQSDGTSRSPNILLILADDLGYADLAANGHATDIATPHLDGIAASGVRFTDGYASHPYCSPSRAGLMSGMYQHRFGFEANSGPESHAAANFGLPRHIPTLAEKLKDAGYATGMIGKWHIGFREGLRPHERGFDHTYVFHSGARSFYPDPHRSSPLLRNGVVVEKEPAYLTDAFAEEAVDFIERSKDDPWFLYLAFNAVHVPMEATEEYEARFPGIANPKRRTLAGMLAAMDDAVGGVMTVVRELGAEENTLVLFYSDNGGIPPKNASLNGPLRGMKSTMFEGGVRVPFLAQWKGTIPPGQVYENPVMGFDCHATALAAAGLTLDNGEAPPLDGVDLLPFLTGKNDGRPHDALYWRAGNQHAARIGDYKIVTHRGAGTMLFNLANDLAEANDLAAAKPEKLSELTKIFNTWSGSMMEQQWIRQDRSNAEPGGKLKENATPGRGAAARTTTIKRTFESADKNGDGKLSVDEYFRPENFSKADTNGDGAVTLEELRARIRAGGDKGGKGGLERDIPGKNSSPSHPDLSWTPGTEDANGVRMNGTEVMKIAAHKGKLFAGTSMWMESDRSLEGGQVLVKESIGSPWKVDLALGPENSRLTALSSFEFRSNHLGEAIDPVRILLASPTTRPGDAIAIWSRRDKVGQWVEMPLGTSNGVSQIRGMGFHRDRVTGVDLVFAGVSGNQSSAASLGMLTGSYKKGHPGRILWNKQPELVLPSGERFMEFAVCNGDLYASSSNHIFKRTDGPDPIWEKVHHDPKQIAPAGLRGLVTVPAPGGKEAILFISFGEILFLDPANDNRVTPELDIPAFLSKTWDLPINGSLAGYNKIVHDLQPNGPGRWLVGFQCSYDKQYIRNGGGDNHAIRIRDDGRRPIRYFASEGNFLIRSLKDEKPRYEVKTFEAAGDGESGAVRTICRSPFTGEEDVLYVGVGECNGMPSHDTARIHRLELP